MMFSTLPNQQPETRWMYIISVGEVLKLYALPLFFQPKKNTQEVGWRCMALAGRCRRTVGAQPRALFKGGGVGVKVQKPGVKKEKHSGFHHVVCGDFFLRKKNNSVRLFG